MSNRLHILNEFDKAVSTMLTSVEQLPTIFEEWEERGQLVRASRGVEFVLSMRRAALDLAVQLQKATNNTENCVLKQEIGKIWLKSAKIARKYAYLLTNTNYPYAYYCALKLSALHQEGTASASVHVYPVSQRFLPAATTLHRTSSVILAEGLPGRCFHDVEAILLQLLSTSLILQIFVIGGMLGREETMREGVLAKKKNNIEKRH